MEKQVFVHKHDKGTANVPVLKHEIRFCNENVKKGQGWYFNTSPYLNRDQRRRMLSQPQHASPSNRKLTRGRLVFRLIKNGIALAKKVVDMLTTGANKPATGRTKLSQLLQNVLRRPKVAFA